MRDVAAAAGVHYTTVSLALRHDRRIPEATREHIAKVAGKLGYKPHPLLSAYASARRARSAPASTSGATLAFIIRADREGDARREHLAGARAAAESQGYRIETFIVGDAADGVSDTRLNTILLTRNIHGIIIAPLPEAHGHFTLEWAAFSSCVIEYTFTEPALDRVVHDSYAGMRLALAKCRERGCRRVGLVLTEAGYERTEGLNDAAFWNEQKSRAGNLAPIPPLHLDNRDTRDFGEWLEKYRPETVITSSIIIERIWSFITSRFRDRTPVLINLNVKAGMPFPGIDQNSRELGATAARMVIDKLNRNDRGVPSVRQTVLIPGQWVEGHTLRDPATTATTV
jgi:LacI family transcriptional regulator/LacI family fructose operon transcriptional repressor